MPDLASSFSDDDFMRRVMRRVYFLYVVRRLTQPVVAETILLTIFTTIAVCLVSIHHVLVNAEATHDIFTLSGFFMRAFMKTTIIIKVTTVGIVATCLALSYGFLKNLKMYLRQSGRLIGQIFVFCGRFVMQRPA